MSSSFSSDPHPEIRSLARGIRVVVVVLMICLATFNLAMAVSIAAFRKTFEETMPGQPLPSLSELILPNQSICIVVALVLPLAAILISVLVQNHFRALTGIAAILILLLLQIAITALALYLPTVTFIAGFSEHV